MHIGQPWEITHNMSVNVHSSLVSSFGELIVFADLRASGGGGNRLLRARISVALTTASHLLGKPSAQGEFKIGIGNLFYIVEVQ